MSARTVDERLLGRVGFTDHAVARFAERAGLGSVRRGVVVPLMRDLLLREGRIVARPPRWARSRNAADLYLQAGEWLLFICRGSRRQLGAFDVVTVISNRKGATWRAAYDRRLIRTAPPVAAPPRVGLLAWLGRALRRLAGGARRPRP